jgi:hypothetical protein
MIIDRKIRTILFLVFSFSALELYSQSSWRTTHRIQMGYENDSNVEEAIKGPRSADNLRLLLDFKAQRQALSFSFQGGYQFYPGFSRENKMANELAATAYWPALTKLQIGIQVWSRLKLFLKSDKDLACGFLQPFVLLHLNRQTTLQIGFRQDALDYAHSDYFDYASPGINIKLRHKIMPNWTLSPMFSWQQSYFQRYAQGQYPGLRSLMLLNERQKDGISAGGFSSEWLWHSLLVTLLYKYEQNRSNSYGYGYDRHVITAMFAQQWGAWFLRGYFSWQKKKYLDALLPFLPIELDTEQEENNFIVLDVSRDVFKQVSVVARMAWYQNESPWANLYYRKTLMQVFMEWRF